MRRAGTSMAKPNRCDRACGGAAAGRRSLGAIVRRRASEPVRQHFFGQARPAPPAQAPSAPCRRRRAAALERRGRRLRPSPDDGLRDPRGGGEFRSMRRRDVARCRAPQHLAGELPALHRGPRARSAHHGPDGFAAGIHQGDLGLSRHSRQRQPPRQGPRDPRQIQTAVRRGGKSLWRRPLHHRVDLGHRIQLLDPDGRSQRAEFHRDAGLHRPPPEIFQGRIPRPRWKSCIAAICAPSSCAAPGPARSGRRNSCRPRSSATPSTPTATAAATWSTIPPT